MPRGKTKQTSAKRSKSVDDKPSKVISKEEFAEKASKKTVEKANKKDTEKANEGKKNIEPEIDDEAESDNDLEFDVDEDEFFDENNFKDFNNKIQFRVFDPEKYETEMHKEIVIVPSAYRKTSEVITKFEFTDVVSNRAKQIENGSPIFVDIKDETDPIAMAELEIRLKRCPLSIRRLISNNIAEIWEVNEMMIPY